MTKELLLKFYHLAGIERHIQHHSNVVRDLDLVDGCRRNKQGSRRNGMARV